MEYVRAVVGGGLIAGLVMLAGAWWSGGAIADTQVLVGAGRLAAPDPAAVGLEEDRLRDLVSALTRRARELDAREESLAAREAMLRELELAFASSTAGTADADAGVDGALAETDAGAPESSCLRGAVAEIYASMPAEEAAPILDRLDDGTLRAVFGPMEPHKAASILAVMSRERAVAFTRALATDEPEPR
jgi:flagellar motility protein MotE (MotC chaperone)